MKATGIVSFLFLQISMNDDRNVTKSPKFWMILWWKTIFGHASQTFRWEASKNYMVKKFLSVWCMRPSKLRHTLASAFRADGDVIVPDCFK